MNTPSINPKKPSRNLINRIIYIVVFELIVLAVSLAAVIVVAAIFVEVSGYFYDINHPIPDPVERGDDLGAGLVMVFSAFASLLISIPLTIFIHLYSFFKFFKRSKK